MTQQTTLRTLMGLPKTAAPLRESTLVMIDCQNTYTTGIMQLQGVDAALVECQRILHRARAAGIRVIHIQHDAGPDSPYDTAANIGQIVDVVAPMTGELVIRKNYPSSFEKTTLDAELKRSGATNLILAGFMTHMCINSTARSAFNHGYPSTVIASATATRNLPNPLGGEVLANDVHRGALAAIADLFALVVSNSAAITD
jgi:nicotinamidase-related amidase